MKNCKTVVLAICALVCAAPSMAQSVRHDILDARAARADIAKLKAERAYAKRHHNWGKWLKTTV